MLWPTILIILAFALGVVIGRSEGNQIQTEIEKEVDNFLRSANKQNAIQVIKNIKNIL